jgi:imidazolonepropionase-like amidohydrolase
MKEKERTEKKIIRAGTLIDGRNLQPIKNAVVVVDGQVISHVGQAERLTLPEGEVVDATAMTVMPGLIDGHVHITFSGVDPMEATMGQPVAYTVVEAVRNLRALLEAGYTAVRCCGDIDHVDIALKRAVERGVVLGPRMLTCGLALSTTGGHGDVYLPAYENMPLPHPMARIVDGVDGVRKGVREEMKAGVDWIKIMHAGIATHDARGIPGTPQFTMDEMRAICEVAHDAGKRVCAHCSSAQAIKNSVLAGVDTIEHGIGIDEESIELMKSRGIFLMSTLSPFFAIPELSDDYVKMGLEETAKKYLELVPPARVMEDMRRAIKAGVKVAPGSDAGVRWYYHGDNALELQLLVEAGMSPMQAIIAGTRTASEAIGLGQTVGTIESGKIADILILDGDPLNSIGILREKKRIHTVMKSGRIVVSEGACVDKPSTYPARVFNPYPTN